MDFDKGGRKPPRGGRGGPGGPYNPDGYGCGGKAFLVILFFPFYLARGIYREKRSK